MKIGYKTFLLFKNICLFSFVIILSITSCKDDDPVPVFCKPSSYNKASHVYATMFDDNVFQNWETIIDLETGLFDTIAGSGQVWPGLDLPIGTRNLTDFAAKKRIYINLGNILVIQDLTTFDSTHINLNNQNVGGSIDYPQHLNFGENKNIIYFIDGLDIFSVNLTSKEIFLIKENLSIDQSQFSDFIYLEESNDFVFLGQKNFSSGDSEYRISRYNMDTDEILYTDSIPHLFGFVKYLDNDDIFALTVPSPTQGFRLTRLQAMEGGVNISQLSLSDLALDELSPYLQTIHTATNSYVCRGGTTNLNQTNPNRLYSINLVNGTVTNEVEIEGYKTMIGLQGE
ncbi:MAG: hypothetical protein AB8H03_02810 [Saprospiraceae bacterium]